MKKQYKRIIACIGDTHIGSKFALFPPEYKDEDGNIYRANAGQRKIYSYWLDFCKKCDELNVDTVIHFGDALHGLNRNQDRKSVV
jgi:hypothetical protein